MPFSPSFLPQKRRDSLSSCSRLMFPVPYIGSISYSDTVTCKKKDFLRKWDHACFFFLRYLIPGHLHPKKKPCTHYQSLPFSLLVTNPCLLNPFQCGALCLSVLVSFCILSLSFHMHFTILNCQGFTSQRYCFLFGIDS